VILEIFRYLTPTDLVILSCVNRGLYRLTGDETLWKKFLQKIAPAPLFEKCIKNYPSWNRKKLFAGKTDLFTFYWKGKEKIILSHLLLGRFVDIFRASEAITYFPQRTPITNLPTLNHRLDIVCTHLLSSLKTFIGSIWCWWSWKNIDNDTRDEWRIFRNL